MLETVGLIASIVIGAATIAWSLHGVKQEIWLQAFLEFTGRYDEIVRRLPDTVRNADEHIRIRDLPPDQQQHVTNEIRCYLNLCSEEHYLAGRGQLDKQTWGLWRQGIESFMRSGVARDVWLQVRDEYSYIPEFVMLVDSIVSPDHRTGHPAT